MQTVPSLIGTGTAIAVAASGLVIGEPLDPNAPSSPPRPLKRKNSSGQGLQVDNQSGGGLSSRPGTSSAAPSINAEGSSSAPVPHVLSSSRPPLSRHQRPPSSHFPSSSRSASRRQSFVRQREFSAPAISEASRDSISSNGSWIRRLSIRPLSHHGSIRSSLDPDSHSITFSHGSGAPILGQWNPAAATLPPNKLVKRTPSIHAEGGNSASLRRSKSHLPTLRRPATSHQRSATLQQFHPDPDLTDPIAPAKFAFDPQLRTQSFLGAQPSSSERTEVRKSDWTSFWHSRTTKVAVRSGPTRLSEFSPHNKAPALSKRIMPRREAQGRIHLVEPKMLSGVEEKARPSDAALLLSEDEEDIETTNDEFDSSGPSTENTPSKRARKSISMTFSSAGNWVSRTSGSIRRPKRGADPNQIQKSGNQRHVSEPLTGAGQRTNPTSESPMAQTPSENPGLAPISAAVGTQRPTRKRNSSSPLPPLSRISSFHVHVDVARLGSATAAPATSTSTYHPTRPIQPSGSSTSSAAAMSPLRATHFERSSLMDGSESDARELTSGDDDTDFKSDTLFDSLRTVASGRVRAVDTPLDSMYDESPPSTSGNSKTKRLSIQEILGKPWDDDNKIMEEDETMRTPVRVSKRPGSPLTMRDLPTDPQFSVDSFRNRVSLSQKELERLSIDNDVDDDWARDDDGPYNSLSPPSQGSSANSKTINPNVRLALARISGNGMTEASQSDVISDRPLSTLFDWSEPPVQDRQEADGHSPRPKTAYAKQDVDSRGGRSAHRKGPAPAHVRSQSVPVIHDAPEDAKATSSKYGTWGIGTKTINEDWGDDFDLGSNHENEGKLQESLFAVPESIRATQPSVRAHSVSIRELSLLVNDLKRLCRHGKEMSLLNGQQKALWEEAEGIIQLASPDEDELQNELHETSSIDFDAFDESNDEESDNEVLNRLDAALEGQQPIMSKTAVVRERPSPRRRSVFLPDDDIFGGNRSPSETQALSSKPSRPRTPEAEPKRRSDVTGVVRTVMDAMNQRPASGSADSATVKRMHFDTNSLKALVKRAGDLRDILSDAIRKVDPAGFSPIKTPKRERHGESSPAFTRVFDDPPPSSPRNIIKARGSNPIMEDTSPENSPSSGINRRMQMMAVQ